MPVTSRSRPGSCSDRGYDVITARDGDEAFRASTIHARKTEEVLAISTVSAGSDEGAENWAMLASLIETCKLHGVNPEAYLSDVLTKLVNNWPNSRLAELTPWAWAAQDH
jgi:hypothetical protein